MTNDIKHTDDKAEKIKVTKAEIVVKKIDKPYFMIRYHEVGKDYENLGFGSYCLENVFDWLDECFEVIESDKNNESVYSNIYKEFCEWSPKHAKMVVGYKPWGHTSIVVWLSNCQAYKCKRYAPGRFTMQSVSKEDISKKYGL